MIAAGAAATVWSGEENARVQAVKVDLQPCIIAKGAIVSSWRGSDRS